MIVICRHGILLQKLEICTSWDFNEILCNNSLPDNYKTYTSSEHTVPYIYVFKVAVLNWRELQFTPCSSSIKFISTVAIVERDHTLWYRYRIFIIIILCYCRSVLDLYLKNTKAQKSRKASYLNNYIGSLVSSSTLSGKYLTILAVYHIL
jgi:hypothetical protein